MSTERQHDFDDFELSERGLQLAISFTVYFSVPFWHEALALI